MNAELTGPQTVTLLGDCQTAEALILEGDLWRYFKGTQEPPAGWNSLAFDDSQWLSGPTPIGFEASSGYASRIATNLTDMQNKYVSVYARREFTIEDPSRVTGLTFTMDYDDGYIAYLNGVRIASASAPNPPPTISGRRPATRPVAAPIPRRAPAHPSRSTWPATSATSSPA